MLSLVSYHFLPARVGGQKGIALFNKYLSEQVKLVCVTTKNNDPREATYEVKNILATSPLRYINPFYFFTLRKIIRQYKITHLLLEHPYYGWLALLLHHIEKTAIVLHAHNLEGNRFHTLGKWWWKILWQYERIIHRKAQTVFFIQDDDKAYAIRQFGLDPAKCHTITYGIEWKAPPAPSERNASAEVVKRRHQVPAGDKLLFFNGAFDYKPNLDALKKITSVINPLLAQLPDYSYTILICGRNIPPEIAGTNYKHIVFAGFVEDITQYFKAADVFLNPVTGGGGIKTKLVEALGYNVNAVSTRTGATGIDENICGGKLAIVEDDDWNHFANSVVEMSSLDREIPGIYFENFYWGNIARKAVQVLNGEM